VVRASDETEARVRMRRVARSWMVSRARAARAAEGRRAREGSVIVEREYETPWFH
jgi:hypothetical protein